MIREATARPSLSTCLFGHTRRTRRSMAYNRVSPMLTFGHLFTHSCLRRHVHAAPWPWPTARQPRRHPQPPPRSSLRASCAGWRAPSSPATASSSASRFPSPTPASCLPPSSCVPLRIVRAPILTERGLWSVPVTFPRRWWRHPAAAAGAHCVSGAHACSLAILSAGFDAVFPDATKLRMYRPQRTSSCCTGVLAHRNPPGRRQPAENRRQGGDHPRDRSGAQHCATFIAGS